MIQMPNNNFRDSFFEQQFYILPLSILPAHPKHFAYLCQIDITAPSPEIADNAFNLLDTHIPALMIKKLRNVTVPELRFSQAWHINIQLHYVLEATHGLDLREVKVKRPCWLKPEA